MKKQTIIALTIIGVLLVATIGATFAYFASNSQNDNAGINAETEELGSILLDGTKVFTSYDLLPGQMGVQEFTIEKNSDTGNGIYEIDLEATVPEEFRSDIEILLYKTTDPTTNNVTVNVADPTLEDEMIYQEDSLNITGTPELVYQGTLTENPQIILEQADFDVSTLAKTTYYLVYHYKNNGNQDDQQGKTFTGTITVRLINEKSTYCDLNPDAATCTILALADSTDELVYDETIDNNLRYIGANPNNYVSFNGELWRIIGVFNNIDDGTGTKETRLKIISDEPIGKYSWDNKASGTGSSTNNYGSNDWSDSPLQQVLNSGAYYNRTSGECPNGINGATTSCDFSTTGLTEEAKSMIGNAVWNLGGSSINNDVTASMFYEKERGDTVYTGRPTEWIGQIGLMYPSDYGYATSGGNTSDRASCLSTELYHWNNTSYISSDCYNNDWLYDSSNNQWTLTSYSANSELAFRVLSSGYVTTTYAAYALTAVSPALYLTSNAKIDGGDGSRENPFILSL